MDDNTLRKLQKTQQDILDAVVEVCLNHGLQYCLVGGTMLGAVRHGGFIPWDDDLDIAMPRGDYEKFVRISEKELREPYHIHSIYTDNTYHLSFVKVKKRGTVFEEAALRNVSTIKEVYIDIFPLDFSDKETTPFRHLRAMAIRTLKQVMTWKKGVKLTESILGRIAFWMFRWFGYTRLDRMIKFLMTFDNGKPHNYITSFGGQYHYTKQTMPIDYYFPTQSIMFEGKMYAAPRLAEKYLEHLYGNWQALPPVEKRMTHNPDRISL